MRRGSVETGPISLDDDVLDRFDQWLSRRNRPPHRCALPDGSRCISLELSDSLAQRQLGDGEPRGDLSPMQ